LVWFDPGYALLTPLLVQDQQWLRYLKEKVVGDKVIVACVRLDLVDEEEVDEATEYIQKIVAGILGPANVLFVNASSLKKVQRSRAATCHYRGYH
jgi:hypothetical protein